MLPVAPAQSLAALSAGAAQPVSSLLGAKEAELLSLRQAAVERLEQQVQEALVSACSCSDRLLNSPRAAALLQVEELKQQKQALRERLGALQDDFMYNLELLDGRDAELAEFERLTERLKAETAGQADLNRELAVKLQQEVQGELLIFPKANTESKAEGTACTM